MAIKNEYRIASLSEWGDQIVTALENGALQELFQRAYSKNNFFTPEFSRKSIEHICHNYLKEENLIRWAGDFEITSGSKSVGLLMAGNLPLVGFHDLISVLISGHKAYIKLSSKDDILLPGLLELANEYITSNILLVNNLKEIDAVIATGSNNSSKYFEYYFKDKAKIIRKNRTSVAILDGNETDEDLQMLGEDVFTYFGLGCRNVGKLMIPKKYDIGTFLKAMESYQHMMDLTKYKNNYDYSFAILMMKGVKFLTNDCLMLIEDSSIYSGVATLHYEYYNDEEDLQKKLSAHQPDIQCIVSTGSREEELDFGMAQTPELWDYADGVNTLDFLSSLR